MFIIVRNLIHYVGSSLSVVARKPLASEDSIVWTSRYTDELPPLSDLESLESLCLELPGSGLVHRRRRSACWPWFRALPGKAWTPVQPPRHWSTLKRTVLWKSHLSEKGHVPMSLHCKICDCKRSKLVIYCKSCILKILHYPDKRPSDAVFHSDSYFCLVRCKLRDL